jgi:hypothetical protein
MAGEDLATNASEPDESGEDQRRDHDERQVVPPQHPEPEHVLIETIKKSVVRGGLSQRYST